MTILQYILIRFRRGRLDGIQVHITRIKRPPCNDNMNLKVNGTTAVPKMFEGLFTSHLHLVLGPAETMDKTSKTDGLERSAHMPKELVADCALVESQRPDRVGWNSSRPTCDVPESDLFQHAAIVQYAKWATKK